MDDVFVGRVMSSPARSITREATMRAAAETMLDHGVSSLVVVDDQGRLVGIVTNTDHLRAAAAGDDPEEAMVADYMTENVETTTANATVTDAAELLTDLDVHHLPVIGDTEEAIGMLTTKDLAAYVSSRGRTRDDDEGDE